MTMAPKTEVYIRLVCLQYKPELVLPLAHPTAPANHGDLPLLPNSRVISSYLSRVHESPDLIKTPDLVVTDETDVHVRVPRPSSKCTSDPEVGRIVAGLNTAVVLTLGILSLITTGYWASVSCLRNLVPFYLVAHEHLISLHLQYSDRVGRKRVLGVSALAGLLMDIVSIITTLHASKIQGGYNLFILCSVIYGTL
jgi:hypothetical protein